MQKGCLPWDCMTDEGRKKPKEIYYRRGKQMRGLAAKKVPAMAGTKMCGMDAFYASQSSLLLRVSQSSPKTVPKPQQERGFAVGEKRSKGKRISSKPLQGSLFVAFVVQRSGTHLPKEFTMILTVRNSFTIVNSPMVTLTAMGAPRAASPLLWEESQSQPQE